MQESDGRGVQLFCAENCGKTGIYIFEENTVFGLCRSSDGRQGIERDAEAAMSSCCNDENIGMISEVLSGIGLVPVVKYELNMSININDQVVRVVVFSIDENVRPHINGLYIFEILHPALGLTFKCKSFISGVTHIRPA